MHRDRTTAIYVCLQRIVLEGERRRTEGQCKHAASGTRVGVGRAAGEASGRDGRGGVGPDRGRDEDGRGARRAGAGAGHGDDDDNVRDLALALSLALGRRRGRVGGVGGRGCGRR